MGGRERGPNSSIRPSELLRGKEGGRKKRPRKLTGGSCRHARREGSNTETGNGH